MTQIQIFHTYFKNKIVIWLSLAIIMAICRYFTKQDFNLSGFLIVVSISVLVALVTGWIDYNHHEHRMPEAIKSLLKQPPLNEFASKGFIQDDNDKVVGWINNFNITMSPFVDRSEQKYLTIIIPLKPQEGLRDLMNNDFEKNFKLKMVDEVFLAEAVLKDFDKRFNGFQLYEFLNVATINFKSQGIMPIEVVEE